MNDWLHEALHYLAISLATGLSTVFQRDSYLYWPYLLSSIAIAAAAWRWRTRPASTNWGDFFRTHFTSLLWWHRSARADYWLYLVNALVMPLAFAVLLVSQRDVVAWFGSAFGLHSGGGTDAAIGLRVVFTILFFIAYDLGRFLAHCLLHDVPLLWEFHKIHHSAEVLTPMTSFRAHPVELVLMAWGPLVTTGMLATLFSAATGKAPPYYSFLGVHALLFVSNLIGNLRHSPVWISYGARWGRWLISPAHHQLHHSCESRHLGCNRGFELAIWDRLYGTLYVPGAVPEKFKLGLAAHSNHRDHELWRMYLLPFAAIAAGILARMRRIVTRLSPR
jgi:sterol desaturase/sphingolipid hydroxylase (fatty acid hydroxylase superfamily)